MRDPRPEHRHASVLSVLATLVLATIAACGGGGGDGDDDDAPPDAADPVIICGNEIVDPGEDCDDGNTEPDIVCDGECHTSCGNGSIEPGELCDTAGSGDDLCPSAAGDCDDADACTQDQLVGAECQAECAHAAITIDVDGDGCCLPGSTSEDDSDCAAECGNGVVESGESCDTGIASGPGACPTACSDGIVCTVDALTGSACTAACSYTPITAPANGDGCCPPGANTGNDTDCVPGCNNGVVDAGETCDTAIASGPGSCPTACSDGMACTTDTLSNGGTCTAVCAYPPITMPANGDGCCPPGANANNDNNCTPVCGNGVMEGTEECDDGNAIPSDGCDLCDAVIQPTAFRMTDLDLRDPHVYVNAVFCQDATDTPVFGIFAVNTELASSITMDDDDADTYLDLNIVLVFRPIDQGSSSTTVAELHFGDCTSTSPTTCYPDPDVVVSSTMNMSSACLGALPNTLTTMYTPEIAAQTAPCFVSDAETITIDLSGIPVTLSNARVAAQYLGTPATQFVNGLVRGFISEASANTTPLPSDLPLVGGQPLAQQLPGGDPPGSGNTNCASHSDKDLDGTTPGWWMYLNFTATQVAWDE